MTFLICDPGWYVHKSDVQTKWDDNTNTHTHTHTEREKIGLSLAGGQTAYNMIYSKKQRVVVVLVGIIFHR